MLFWLLFGAGFDRAFRFSESGVGGQSFLEFYFPETMALILLFTAIFATISIIEDRREGFLQSVLVAPIPRWSMVLGKILGGTLIALFQGLIFLLLALTIRVQIDFVSLIQLVGLLFVAGLALTSLGFVIAWPLDSTQGFHAVMSMFLMPMWLLSGAFFPAGETGWLAWIIRLNPLTYGVAGLRRLLYIQDGLPVTAGLPSLPVSILVTVLFSLICVALSVLLANRRLSKDTR